MDRLDSAGVRELFKSLRDKDKTMLLASHNSLDVEESCDAVCGIDGGAHV